MLSQTTWLPTLLLIISLTVYTVKSDSHVTVSPTCPTDSDPSILEDTCHTLSDLISNISNSPDILRAKYLEIKFLHGTHVLRESLVMTERMNVALYGENATIACGENFFFNFIEIETLKIKYLTFCDCGGQISKDRLSYLNKPTIRAALYLENVAIQLEAVTVQNSRGYGLFGLNLKTASIVACNFINNSRECGKPKGIGGNIALHFKNISHISTITIESSVIKGGNDDSCNSESEFISSCNSTDTSTTHRANGLVVVYLHEEHQVIFGINNSNFSGNMRNKFYPSVLVHDSTGLKNELKISNSRFIDEGSLVISVNLKGECRDMKNCYASKSGKKKLTNLASIVNCIFSGGIQLQTALKICVKPTYLRNNKFGVITISDSHFQDFSNNTVEITYNYAKPDQKNKYPGILIKIQKCVFTLNKISSVIFTLNQDRYLLDYQSNRDTGPVIDPIFSLINVTFRDNENLESSTVMIAVQNPHIHDQASKYPFNKNHQYINIASITSCTFTNNSANSSKGVLSVQNAFIKIRSTAFISSSGTALHAVHSTVIIEDNNLFKENHGDFGGALKLDKSRLFFLSSSFVHITGNTAKYHGGGIFATTADTECSQKQTNCSSLLCTVSTSNDSADTLIKLEGNGAFYTGSSIYGGKYSGCISYCNETLCHSIPEKDNQPIPSYISYGSDISSPAIKLCLCQNDSILTDQCTNISKEVFPGQTFKIPLAALSGLHMKTQAVVTAKMDKERNPKNKFVDIGYGQQIQLLEEKCINVSYRVNSDSNRETLQLAIDERGFPPSILQTDTKPTQSFSVEVILKECPKGFEILNKTIGAPACRCKKILNETFNVDCDINTGISVKGNMWIGSVNYTNHRDDIVIYEKCPFDYCNCSFIHDQCSKTINLEDPDAQCSYNRHGTLCGACQNGYSIVLGTSNCMECSNVYLLLIIPFALAGVALVVLLLKCNLTVSVGHINGIIFYANIVQVNKALLFPNQSTAYKIFSTFIAWLNLDLGIETCFFENMDSYGKVWLQFVFPVYLWLIIALIIILASKSAKLGRLIGNNSVPVLATLFLLSYAKLLRTIIAAVSFTFIVFEDKSYYITVWLKNGNVEYFSPKHFVLFAVALLFTFLFILPLTLLVLLAPCLQARSHHKAFKWVNRLKPFLDAYQGPYTDKFRFWTGLFLVIRILLFLIDSSNYENDPSMSFFCTITTTAILAFVLLRRAVYRHQLANWIELVSLINIVILCLVNWLTTSTNYGKWHAIREYATYTSVAVMMGVFLGILLYQLKLVVCFNAFIKRGRPVEPAPPQLDHGTPVSAATSSTVELEECNELKEPLLDTN